jgi:hypothetical protein
MCRPLRGQARSYMGSAPRFAAANHIRGSRLAGEGVVSGDNDGGCAGLFAGKRAPTRDSTHPDHLRRPRFRGSRLAGEGVVSGDNDGGCAGLFAGKRAPTWDQHPDLLRQTTSVGAGLLAKALCLAITMVDVPASSRASALLQGIQHRDHLRRPRFRRSRLAGESVVSGDNDGGRAGVFAGERAPTRDLHPNHLRRPRFRRSRLAGEGVVSGDNDGGCAGFFAGKRAPTRDSTLPSLAANTRSVH